VAPWREVRAARRGILRSVRAVAREASPRRAPWGFRCRRRAPVPPGAIAPFAAAIYYGAIAPFAAEDENVRDEPTYG
jgi:hypothetical protein